MFKMIIGWFLSFMNFFAKVDGPLMSLEARGKIADAIVFFPWKGRHVVRQWLKPVNKKSTKQGYIRAALSAIGKWVSIIQAKAKGNALDSVIYQACTSTADAGMNWNGFIAQGLLEKFQTGHTFLTALFTSMVAEYSALTAAVLSAWGTDATIMGLEDLTFGYGYITNMPAGLQLYFGAKACWNKGIIGTAPYTTDPKSWVATDINIFKTDHTTNV